MSAADLLADLARRGVRLEAAGERLRYFPRSALTPELLDRLKAHKAELLAMLRAAGQAPPAAQTAAKSAADDLGIVPPARPAEARLEHPPLPAKPRDKRKTGRRLVGNGFPPIAPEVPPENIHATPRAVCPCCRLLPVLPELRGMTGGRCYECWRRN